MSRTSGLGRFAELRAIPLFAYGVVMFDFNQVDVSLTTRTVEALSVACPSSINGRPGTNSGTRISIPVKAGGL